jgi:hypothetical protein
VPGEATFGSRRLLDILSLGLAGVAAAALLLLGRNLLVSAACALCVLVAALALWRASRLQAQARRAGLQKLLSAQARLGEILIPVWRGQIDASCRHMSQAAETLAMRLGTAVRHLGQASDAGTWQAERSLALAELREATLHLQFQDRVSQMLGHVSHSISLTAQRMGESRRHFERGGLPAGVDVDALIAELESSYTTPDEFTVHQDQLGDGKRQAAIQEETEHVTYF